MAFRRFCFDFCSHQSSGKSLSVPGLDRTSKQDGNFEEIAKAGSFHEFLVVLHKRFGPIASFWWKKHQVVSIASAELFAETQHMFDRPPEPFESLRLMCKPKSIQFANRGEGQRRRNHYNKALSETAISYQRLQEVANELVASWIQLFNDNETDMVPLTRYIANYSLKATIHALYANVMADDSKDELKYLADVEMVWTEMERNFVKPRDEERLRHFHEGEKDLNILTKKMLDDRKAKPPEKGDETLLDLFISFSDDEEVQLADALEFAIFGQYCLEYFLTCALYYIATHHTVDKGLQKELRTVIGESDVNQKNIKDLVYLRQVLDETLRCSVLGPWAARFKGVEWMLGGFDIPKNTYIFQALGVCLKDDKVWTEPDRFDPDRFSQENRRALPEFAFSSFGVGQRECLAKHFSYAAATVAMVTLLRKFKVELADSYQVLIPVYGLCSHPKEEIFLKISKR